MRPSVIRQLATFPRGTRQAARAEERDARRAAVLYEMQTAAYRFACSTGATHAADVRHHRTTGEPFARQQLLDGWSEEALEPGVGLDLLVARVGDEELVCLVEEFNAPCTMANFVRTEEEGTEQLLRMQQALPLPEFLFKS